MGPSLSPQLHSGISASVTVKDRCRVSQVHILVTLRPTIPHGFCMMHTHKSTRFISSEHEQFLISVVRNNYRYKFSLYSAILVLLFTFYRQSPPALSPTQIPTTLFLNHVSPTRTLISHHFLAKWFNKIVHKQIDSNKISSNFVSTSVDDMKAHSQVLLAYILHRPKGYPCGPDCPRPPVKAASTTAVAWLTYCMGQ